MKKWKIIGKTKVEPTKLKTEEIIKILLANRKISSLKGKEKFLSPARLTKISLREAGLSKVQIEKTKKRVKQAKKNKEKVIVYGDYDADGVCATGIIWEALYKKGLDVIPHIPNRFTEGYGLNVESIKELKTKNPKLKLIITVDNGIVAYNAVKEANKLGIDIIITDHHQKQKKLPAAYSIIHSTMTSGAGVAWFVARELNKTSAMNSLDLVAIGTIADQLPLMGINRSLVKYGLEALKETSRVGLKKLYRQAAVVPETIGAYSVSFVIAPRINAMGRMKNGIDALRLLCTKSPTRAQELSFLLGKTNTKRQEEVEKAVSLALQMAKEKDWKGVIVIAHEAFHEGVIGLVASRLVDEYYRPAIVLSKGKAKSKASARSITGFNMIKNIRKLDNLIHGGGGHPMAAGFTIDNKKIDEFTKKLTKQSRAKLTKEVLSRKLKIDLEVDFINLTFGLANMISKFSPFGIGNPTPVFSVNKVEVLNVRTVGKEARHLKLKLTQNDKMFDAIGFNLGHFEKEIQKGSEINIAFGLEINKWQGNSDLQLNIKDIKPL